MTHPLTLIVSRHGDKIPETVVPGSEEDKKVPLSDLGRRQATESGERYLPRGLDHITVVTSGFTRTEETAALILRAKGYSMDRANVIVMPEIGLSGSDWKDSGLPKYDPAAPDPYITALLTKYYYPNPDRPNAPVMGRRTAHLLDALVKGIEAENGRDNSAVVTTTHGSIIDGAANAIYGSLCIPSDGKNPYLLGFPGAFNMGECFTGYIPTQVNDRLVVFNIKDGEARFHVSQLKSMADKHRM